MYYYQTTTSDYSSINSSEGGLANKTVNYHTTITAYQFDLEVRAIKWVSSSERTSLTRVFEEGARNIVRCDSH